MNNAQQFEPFMKRMGMSRIEACLNLCSACVVDKVHTRFCSSAPRYHSGLFLVGTVNITYLKWEREAASPEWRYWVGTGKRMFPNARDGKFPGKWHLGTQTSNCWIYLHNTNPQKNFKIFDLIIAFDWLGPNLVILLLRNN